MRIAYDIIGNKEKAVAVIGANQKANRKIAEEIMRRQKNVKTVLQKMSERRGKYRLYARKIILGDKNTEVLHKEYGMVFKLDPQKVYFSPRESTERQRIAEMAKNGEKILIMFSGVAPFAIAIAKKKASCKIYCVDINPYAIKYARENVKLNRVNNVENFCKDVRKFKAEKSFDRIIMPYVNSLKYMNVALKLARKRAIIHAYGLSDMKIDKRILKHCKMIKKEKVLPFAPKVLKVRFDLKVL